MALQSFLAVQLSVPGEWDAENLAPKVVYCTIMARHVHNRMRLCFSSGKRKPLVPNYLDDRHAEAVHCGGH